MEEKVEVKAVEEKVETSPAQKEAAVLDAAVKEGDVNPEYGLQSDGVYKINLDKPPKQKEDAVQEQSTNEVSVRDGSETSEEVQKENKEKSEEPTGKNKQEENPINLNLDGVFVYMSGSKPITDFLGDQIALKEDGGVIVDDFMSTNSDGVWAIGDIRNTPFKQAVVAASDGCIAAMSIDRYLNSRKNIRVDWIHS